MPQSIISAVKNAGYGASLNDTEKAAVSGDDGLDSLKDTEMPKQKRRPIASLGF